MANAVNEVMQTYKRLERAFPLELHNSQVTYDVPVNFKESAQHPRHRWFPYKEGFSPSFVTSFLEHYHSTGYVLDPFSGVGTTLLEAARLGINSVGVEVNPLASFIAEVKTLCLSEEELHGFDQMLNSFITAPLTNVASPPVNPTVNSYFEARYLEAILRVKVFMMDIPNVRLQNLFKVAFLSVLETFSTHRKAGNGLKRKTLFSYRQYAGANPLERVRNLICDQLRVYRHDLVTMPLVTEPKIIRGSSLEIERATLPVPIGSVLTSPPYANCFDYTKIYISELWLGDFFTQDTDQKELRNKSVRSHVHARWQSRYSDEGSDVINQLVSPILSEQKLWSKQIPEMLTSYFMDLGHLLRQLYSFLEAEGYAGIVVGNSAYGGVPIATDLLLADLAQRIGFQVEKVKVYRGIIPSSQQYMKLAERNYLRESMVVLRKSS